MTDCSCVIEVLTEGPQGPAGAPGEPIIAMIRDEQDVGEGGWWVARDYHGPAVMNYLRAEVLLGTVSGVTLSIRLNGVLVRDGIMLSDTAPIILTDLGLVLAVGDAVSVHREGGTVGPGPWLAMVQIDGRV